MAFESYREKSRENWGREGSPATREDLQLGCMLRIADSLEKLAGNFIQLEKDRDWYKKMYLEYVGRVNKLDKRISGFKGYITKIKKQNGNHKTT